MFVVDVDTKGVGALRGLFHVKLLCRLGMLGVMLTGETEQTGSSGSERVAVGVGDVAQLDGRHAGPVLARGHILASEERARTDDGTLVDNRAVENNGASLHPCIVVNLASMQNRARLDENIVADNRRTSL